MILIASSCSTDHYQKSADTEVADIVSKNQNVVLDLEQPAPPLDISTPYSAIEPQQFAPERIVNERRFDEPRCISLEEAIDISIRHRRDYQSEKEALYLVALDLTRARHDYAPALTSLGTQGRLSSSSLRDANGDFDETERQSSFDTRASFDQAFRTGGAIALDLAHDIASFYLGGNGNYGATRFFAGRLTQPLLRGRGSIATENLTQRERNVAYAVRSFSRFQQRNVIDVTRAYFRILQQKDRVRNEFASYNNLVVFADRARALAEDRLPRFQLDQAKQSELRARARYIAVVKSYNTLVDDFKIILGLPLGGELLLEDSALHSLEGAGLPEIPLDSRPALEIAIDHRLDLFNEIDRFEDAKRRIQVAADAFKPGLNLFAAIDVDTDNDSRRFSNFNPDAYYSRIGLDLDLPVDTLDERNVYRRARIDFERQIRQLSLALDRTHADLRNGLRDLDLSRQTYQIQQNALKLANQRVEGANLLVDAGRANTRDLLDAQTDLLNAQNGVTSALVDYHLARLDLLYDLGIFDANLPEFWVRNPEIPAMARKESQPAPVAATASERLITPEELFEETPPRS
jgi:outer membrane protein TolC